MKESFIKRWKHNTKELILLILDLFMFNVEISTRLMVWMICIYYLSQLGIYQTFMGFIGILWAFNPLYERIRYRGNEEDR